MHSLVRIILLISFVFVSLSSCKNEKNKTDSTDNQTGEIKNIKCRADTSYSYQIYLPSEYKTGKKFPAIYFFDAHARSIQVLDSLKKAAERFNYIIIVSNDYRNGAKDLKSIVNKTLNDSKNRFPLNKERIYTAGFSGGARLAARVANVFPYIKGCIACSAGITGPINLSKRNTFHLIHITGRTDFNYMEIHQKHNKIKSNQIEKCILVFNGSHQLPTKQYFTEALLFLELKAMKNNLKEENSSFIQHFYKKKLQKIDSLDKAKDEKILYEEIQKTKNFFKDLKNLRKINKIATKQESPKTNKKPVFKREQFIRNKYTHALKTENISWWYREIDKIDTLVNKTKNRSKIYFYQRIRNYLEMITYLFLEQAFSKEDLGEIRKYLSIYEKLNNRNPDYLFAKSRYHLLNNQMDSAKSCLKRSINNGLQDIHYRLQNDKLWNSLYKKGRLDELFNK
jgi:predicted esterase